MKHHFLNKFHRKGLQIFWEFFKHFRNMVANSLRIAKRDYYTGLILENKYKPKLMWKCLKNLLPGKAKSTPHGLLVDGQILNDHMSMANAFNEFFTSVGHNLAEKIPTTDSHVTCDQYSQPNIPAFKFPTITTEFVRKQLELLPENKAMGLDKFSGKLLRAAAPIICNPLTFIMNLSLQSGKFITEWKLAKVIPIHKSGPRTDRNNYRPISILPIVSKILERFVHKSFTEFLDQYNLVTCVQSGFRSMNSTVTALLNVTDRWLENIDKGLVTGVVFIDLRKAFDTVDIGILLNKLSVFGVTSTEKDWFQSYLTGRMQSLAIGGQTSAPLPVTIGVPQGSILGPLLFMLYLNDLPSITDKCLSTMYADDTEIEHACEPKQYQILESTIKNDLQKLKTYFNENRLSVNIDKCQFMLIGTYQSLRKIPELNIYIDDQHVQQVSSAKYLGMLIDSTLKWDLHIDNMVKKISAKIAILRSLRKIVPVETLKLLYNAIVQPHFDYADVVYDNGLKTDTDRLQ